MSGNKALVVYASAVNLRSGDASMKGTLSTHGWKGCSTATASR